LGNVQMNRLNEILERRQNVANWYFKFLKDIPAIELPHISDTTTNMSWFVFVIRLSQHINRDSVIQTLSKNGIPARPYFAPIHLQPYMVKKFGFKEGDFPITEDLGTRSLALPFSGVMSLSEVERVCMELEKIIRKFL